MRILRKALESVLAHTRQSWPSECCGILLSEYGDPNKVSYVLYAENDEKDFPESAYIIGHMAHIRAIELEASYTACIAGYYHSHPSGGTRPSYRDRKQAVEGVTYLIVDCSDGQAEYKAWKLKGEDFLQENLKVIEDEGNDSSTSPKK